MTTDSSYERDILAWRTQRRARLTASDGWLSLIGRFELPEGVSRVGSDQSCEVLLPAAAPPQLGVLVRGGTRVTFTPAQGVATGVQRARQQRTDAINTAVELVTDAQGEPDRVAYGSLSIEIMQRTHSFAVRVRDTQSTTCSEFKGIPYFPIRPEWRIHARLVPYEPPKRIDLLYESGDPEPYHSPGAAVFEWQGVEYRLDPVFDGNRPRLYIVFGDLTNRDDSYGAGRFLYAPLPRDGRVLLDFNQAFNPPCAFTPYAVCPLPPPQNRLALRIEAGERRTAA